MRIASGSTDKKVLFVAKDATDFTTNETGLSSFTVYRSRNGGTATAYTTPTIAEIDATNMPGLYSLVVDEDTTITSGDDEESYVLRITHAGMAPVTIEIELYRPKITEGETVGASSGAVSSVTATGSVTGGINTGAGTITTLDGLDTAQDAQHATTQGKVDTAQADLDILTGSDGATLATAQANYAPAKAGDAMALTSGERTTLAAVIWNSLTSGMTTVGSIGKKLADWAIHSAADVWAVGTRTLTAATNITSTGGTTVPQTGDSYARLGAPAGADLAADIAAVKSDTAATLTDTGTTLPATLSTIEGKIDVIDGIVDAILVDTDTTIPALIAALNDPNAATIAAAVLAAGDVDGYTVEETLKLCLAALVGKLSGAATPTVAIRAADDSKDRITATVDADGNRSAVTLDAAG